MRNALQRIRRLVLAGRYVEALTHCRNALQSDPTDIPVLAETAQLLVMPFEGLDSPSEARLLLTSALQRFPDAPLLHFSLGVVCQYGFSDHRAAVVHYRRAHSLDPGNAQVSLALARAFDAPEVQMGPDEARSFAEEAVDAAPTNWEARAELARLYWLVGRLCEAEVQFQAALTCAPPPDVFSKQRISRMLQKIAEGVSYRTGYPSTVS